MKTGVILLFFLVGFGSCNSQPAPVHAKTVADTGYTYGKKSADGIGKFYLGREISYVMGADGSDWLERKDRNAEENTNVAISKMPVQPNSVVADIGAGTGYYSFQLVARVPQGKVYAVEIQDELISILLNKKAQLRDSIVEIVKGSVRSPNLPPNSIDLAIMVDVYHELEYPVNMLQALQKALKPSGKILLIEYRGEDPAVRIKPLHKTTVGQLNKEMKANGFRLKEKGDFLPVQHFLIYEKMDRD